MITAQIIYKLQVLFKKQEIRKNNKYCLILVQICVPIFALSQVFTGDIFCCDFDSASLERGLLLPAIQKLFVTQSRICDHWHQNKTIGSENDTPFLSML